MNDSTRSRNVRGLCAHYEATAAKDKQKADDPCDGLDSQPRDIEVRSAVSRESTRKTAERTRCRLKKLGIEHGTLMSSTCR